MKNKEDKEVRSYILHQGFIISILFFFFRRLFFLLGKQGTSGQYKQPILILTPLANKVD